MSTYKRLPRGKIKPRDDFRDWTFHAIVWVKNNLATVAELALIAGVAVGVVIGANFYWQHRSSAAAEMLYKASLQSPGSDEQLAKFAEIVDGYSRTPAGRQAMMWLGVAYLDRKDYDKALAQFRMLAGRSRNYPILEIAALHQIAATELARGDAAAAAETYLKAAADPHNELATESRLRAAGAFERMGDVERAAGLYRQVIKDAGDEDRAARNAGEERLLWLMANGKVKG